MISISSVFYCFRRYMPVSLVAMTAASDYMQYKEDKKTKDEILNTLDKHTAKLSQAWASHVTIGVHGSYNPEVSNPKTTPLDKKVCYVPMPPHGNLDLAYAYAIKPIQKNLVMCLRHLIQQKIPFLTFETSPDMAPGCLYPLLISGEDLRRAVEYEVPVPVWDSTKSYVTWHTARAISTNTGQLMIKISDLNVPAIAPNYVKRIIWGDPVYVTPPKSIFGTLYASFLRAYPGYFIGTPVTCQMSIFNITVTYGWREDYKLLSEKYRLGVNGAPKKEA